MADEPKDTKRKGKAGDKAAGEAGATITVRGPAAGRRRAGILFTDAETIVDLADISVADLDAITEDPLLSVKHG